MNILDELAGYAEYRVGEYKKNKSFDDIRKEAESLGRGSGDPFQEALAAPGVSLICEVKKASPSKGLIAPEFPYLEIAKEYDAAGASAISCLTEPKWFLGADSYLQEITEVVSIPVLRKDFTVDPYMIYQAKTLGASAVLLIVSVLKDAARLREYREIAESLGMSALVEAHDGDEIRTAVSSGAKIIGVNNRNLKNFSVDMGNSLKLREEIPDNVLYVSESGIKKPEDVGELYRNGVDAVLIGEMLMRSPDKAGVISSIREACSA